MCKKGTEANMKTLTMAKPGIISANDNGIVCKSKNDVNIKVSILTQ
jgi:filamentous hemagglutinin family protein